MPESAVYIKTFRLLGANPTPIPRGEVYTSLQTGVVDGMEGSSESVYTEKFYEVTKYLSKTFHIYAGPGLFISLWCHTLE